MKNEIEYEEWVHFKSNNTIMPCEVCGEDTKFTPAENEDLFICGIICLNEYYLDTATDED